MAKPLRKVIDTVWIDGRLRNKLECGHLVLPGVDKFGRQTVTKKRQCKACAGLKSQMPYEVK